MNKNNMHLPKVIFSLFGPPGSGKGTLSERLARELNFAVLSTGNLCRQHIAAQSDLGLMLNEFISKGKLIPDELIFEMVRHWLVEKTSKGLPVILDGFPRTSGQADRLLSLLPEIADAYAFKVLFIELADDEIIKRLSSRLVCSNNACQSVFKEADGVSVCPYCNAALVKRDDDREEVIKARLSLYPEYRDALVAMYQTRKQPIAILDVKGMTQQQVFDSFCAMI